MIDAINGQTIESPSQAVDVLAELKPEQAVSVQLTKPSESKSTVKVTLGQHPGTSS